MINRILAISGQLARVLAAGGLIASSCAYVYAQEPAKEAAVSAAPAAPSPDAIRRGQDLFDGRARFANKGAACTACHHVHHDAIIGGGGLSTDLTQSFSRMGKEGLGAILGSAPFPVMQAAYAGNQALAPDEIQALVAFLQHADEQQRSSGSEGQPLDIALKMTGAGAAGALVLMGFFSLVGRRRKRQSVNQEIYDRQVKSE